MPYEFNGDAVTFMVWVMTSLRGKPVTVEEISNIHNNLNTQMNIETGVDLRRTPHGFYSEEVASIIGMWKSSEYAKKGILTKKGLRLAVINIISQEALFDPVMFGEVSKFIGFKLPADFFDKTV
jgi:hypothetical protein